MVSLTKIYTRTGDDGTTGLVGGGRVSKASIKVGAYGDVDELNAHLAVCHSYCTHEKHTELQEIFTTIQNELFDIGAELASPPNENREAPYAITEKHVERLEHWIDSYNAPLPPLKSFVLPGGSPLNAHLHVARTVCRRAERSIALLKEEEDVSTELFHYINRLSDLLFVLSRYVLHTQGVPEHLWIPGASRPA